MGDKPLRTYLRTYRLRTGLSHDDIAYLLGSIYGSNVAKHERSKRLPVLRHVIAYEVILGAPIRNLYEGLYGEVKEELVGRIRALYKSLARRRSNRRHARKLAALDHLLAALACDP
jgi:hypothetical protein